MGRGDDVSGIPAYAPIRAQFAGLRQQLGRSYASPYNAGVNPLLRQRQETAQLQQIGEAEANALNSRAAQDLMDYSQLSIGGQQTRDQMRLQQLEAAARLASPQLYAPGQQQGSGIGSALIGAGGTIATGLIAA